MSLNSLSIHYQISDGEYFHVRVLLSCSECKNGEPIKWLTGLMPVDDALPIDYAVGDAREHWVDNKFDSFIHEFMQEFSGKSQQYELESFVINDDLQGLWYPFDTSLYHGDQHNISSQAALKVYNYLNVLNTTCVPSNAYQPLYHNCIDFVQEVYQLAELPGHFVSYMPSFLVTDFFQLYAHYAELNYYQEPLDQFLNQAVEYLSEWF